MDKSKRSTSDEVEDRDGITVIGDDGLPVDQSVRPGRSVFATADDDPLQQLREALAPLPSPTAEPAEPAYLGALL